MGKIPWTDFIRAIGYLALGLACVMPVPYSDWLNTFGAVFFTLARAMDGR